MEGEQQVSGTKIILEDDNDHKHGHDVNVEELFNDHDHHDPTPVVTMIGGRIASESTTVLEMQPKAIKYTELESIAKESNINSKKINGLIPYCTQKQQH